MWRSLVPVIINLPPSRSNIYAQLDLAENAIALLENPNLNQSYKPQIAEIEEILTAASKNAQITRDTRLQAYAMGTRGKLLEITQQYAAAEQYTKQALNLISNFSASDLTYQYFWQLGRVYNHQNQIDYAIAAYTKAFDGLQSLRSDIATINPDVQFSFRDSKVLLQI
jgi:tetratricopeptide (TPR) repeat protein